MRCAIIPCVLIGVACQAQAAVDPVTVAQAVPVVKESVTLLKEIAKVPIDIGEIFLLPMGLVECVFSPLPGVEFMSGLKHIGTGVKAPFNLVIDTTTLPYDAAVAVGGTADLAAQVIPVQ